MKDFFENVYVISLDNLEGGRRREALRQHMRDVAWPFCETEFHTAIHGDTTGYPWWWKVGGGAWGCYRSHLAIIEKHLSTRSDKPILILEDDVVFCENFTQRAKDYLENLPDDWGMAYFGRQHLKQHERKPQRINEYVDRPFNVNRTHAYALRGHAFIQKLYKWLLELPAHSEEALKKEKNAWQMFDNPKGDKTHHIDHRYGVFTERSNSGIYSPAVWLAGQREGKSGVSGKDTNENWWYSDTMRVGDRKPLVVVLGLHNSGSTVLAHLLNGIGVHFGDSLGNGPWGVAYEQPHFRAWCEEVLRFPYVGFAPGASHAYEKIIDWIDGHRWTGGEKKITGIKFPFLSCIFPQIYDRLEKEGIRIVYCDRPLENSVKGLCRRMGDAFPETIIRDHQAWLYENQVDFLAKHESEIPVYRYSFDALTQNPSAVLHDLCNFLNVDYPAGTYAEHLCRFVEKDRNHFASFAGGMQNAEC